MAESIAYVIFAKNLIQFKIAANLLHPKAKNAIISNSIIYGGHCE